EATRLEEAIRALPESIEPYMVYGDWLSEQGDPLGELVAIQIKRVDRPRDQQLKNEEVTLIRRHSRDWYGELNGEEGFSASWRWGFFDTVQFGNKAVCSMDPVQALSALFRLPTACFLRGLELGDFGELEEENDDDGFTAWGRESSYGEILD